MTILAAAAEPSKVPFYIAGALLVIWAVGLAGVGLNRPAFPVNLMGQRVVILISLLLAALVLGTAISTA